MNKCISFTATSSEVIGQMKKWIEANPDIVIISHSHAVSNCVHYIIVVYTQEDKSIKL